MTSPSHTADPAVRHATPESRVLLLITRNQRRGAESFAHALCQHLHRRGFAPRLLALTSADVEPRLPVPSLGRSPLSAQTLWRLRREMRRAHVVVACGSTTLPASVIAGTAVSTPVIYQNIGDPMYWAGRGLRHARVRAMLGRTSAVAALSEQSAAALRSHFGVPGSRVTVIPNARSAADFRPATAVERETARRDLGLSPHARVVALAGALTPEKRVDVAIKAVGELADVTLVVAGDGPLRAELVELADALAPGRVRFLGQLQDLTPALHAADAAMLSSDSEGIPGVLIEAGLCGLPAVATDVGYVRDVVVPGVTGEVVPAGQPHALAHELSRVLDAAESLGAQARHHCVRNFDLDHVMDQWADLIRAALEQGGR